MKEAGAALDLIMEEVAVLNQLKALHAPIVLRKLELAQLQLAAAVSAGQTKKQRKGLAAAVKSLQDLLPRKLAEQEQKSQREYEVKATAQHKQKSRQSALCRSDGRLWADVLRTQRKIHNLLSQNGGMGHTFTYFMELSDVHKFLPGDNVYLTEKWDGTTMQVLGHHLLLDNTSALLV
jgi:hypothetical protein